MVSVRQFPLPCLVLCFFVQQLEAQSLVVLSEDGRQAWFAPSPSSAALPVSRIVRLIDSDGDGPVPPPTPGSELERLAATWITKVVEYRQRDDHRQALAGMYTLLSQQIAKGSFRDLEQLQKLTEEMQVMLLGVHLNKWDAWGRDVVEYLGSNVSTLGAAASAYQEIAAGLDSQSAISPQLLALLMMIIKLLLAKFGA